MTNDKTDYDEYIPNNKYLWNQRTFDAKLKNIIKVLNDLDADIIALQEIENENLIKLLKQKLHNIATTLFFQSIHQVLLDLVFI